MATNNIPEGLFLKQEKQHKYQITISDIDDQKVLYINDSFSGLLITMEEVAKINGLEVEGHHQFMAWGNPLLQMYCYDQLTKEMKKQLPLVIAELEKMGTFKKSTIDDLNNWIKGKEQQ